jgi:hypothetical protein
MAAANQIYILKGRFKALTTNTFGIFIIFIEKATKAVSKMSVIASHFSSMYENDPEQPWNKFEETISQLKYNGEISANLSNDFQSFFISSFLADVVEGFIDAFETKNFSKTEGLLTSLIEKILTDKNIFIQLEKQTVTREDIDKVRQDNEVRPQADKPAEPAKQGKSDDEVRAMFNIEEGGILLSVDLVIGPINGIPIYELRAGDQIVVKIAGRTEKEQYFINLLNAKNDQGEILPVRAVVKEIIADQEAKTYNLLVEIGPGIFGRASEQEKVKLKRYDPMLDARLKKANAPAGQAGASRTFTPAPSAPARTSSPVIFLVLIGGVALILTILFLVFLKIL